MSECVGIPEGMEEASEKVFEEVKFIFVRLNVLREYLERELAMPNLPFDYDFDRAIDDWVFMCFFVGKFVCLSLHRETEVFVLFYTVYLYFYLMCKGLFVLKLLLQFTK